MHEVDQVKTRIKIVEMDRCIDFCRLHHYKYLLNQLSKERNELWKTLKDSGFKS